MSQALVRQISRFRHTLTGSGERAGAFELFVAAAGILTALIVISPIVSILVLALSPAGDIWQHLIEYVLPRALIDTMLLLIGVALGTLILGVTTAKLISSYDFPGRSWMLWLLPLPLAVPTYISAYIYVEIFEPLGWIHQGLQALGIAQAALYLPQVRSLPGAILILSVVLYPYLYLSARAMFQTMGSDHAEAARMLGASRWQIAWRITWPMAQPAIAVGLALVLLETLNDIGASEYLGVRTLTVSIFTTWLNRGSLAGAAQLACLSLVIVMFLIWLERYGRRRKSYDTHADNPRFTPRKPLRGLRAALALAACLMPVVFGLGLPVVFLARSVILRGIEAFPTTLFYATLNSVTLAGGATLLAVGLGLAAVAAARWQDTSFFKACVMVAGIGYALPGTVLALGLLTPLVRTDEAINALLGIAGLPHHGLLIAGSGLAIVLAYVIRFSAVSTGFMQAGFARIPREYDDSARVAGAREAASLKRIYLPLLRPALTGAAIVVFVDCLKELPATLLLRPLNVETLATSIYQYASRGSFEDGALAALLIVLAGLGPIIYFTRAADLSSDTGEHTTLSVEKSLTP